MSDFLVSKVNHTGAKSSDHIAAFNTFTSTPAFKQTMSNPIAREQFIRMTEGKKQLALEKGDNELFKLCGSLVTAAKQYSQPKTNTTPENAGTRLDSNNFFAIG